jgi:GMP synthase-like glutamine amidotransferase
VRGDSPRQERAHRRAREVVVEVDREAIFAEAEQDAKALPGNPGAYPRAVKPVLIRQHVESAPPGLLAEWLEARGIPYEVSRSWLDGPLPDPSDYAFVVSLGHTGGPGDTHDPAVVAELELLRAAVDRDVPVLGLCFGGEALAAVLGARVEGAAPELGWREIETDDPDAIPAGPWLEFHFERFATPPGATEVGRRGDATQAFRLGPHLALQFHPEATVEIVKGWAEHVGVEVSLDASPERREAARAAAFRLFDAFLANQY